MSHNLAAKRGLKEGAEAMSEKASQIFLTVLTTLSCVCVSGAARKRELENKTISRM